MKRIEMLVLTAAMMISAIRVEHTIRKENVHLDRRHLFVPSGKLGFFTAC